MLVVADTSPLNYLILLDQTALLPALYTQVVLPPAVVAELGTWVTSLPGWCEVRRPQRTCATSGSHSPPCTGRSGARCG